jgi:carboxymethylenebutenolidase
VDAHTVEIAVATGSMPCYEARPDPATRSVGGAVVVLQEAFGVNAHIEDVTRRFAEAGYHAAAPHLFHRTGSPALGYDELDKVMPHLGSLSDEGILADVDAVLAHLGQAGWALDQTGAVGFCMGGRASFLVAGSRPLGAAVGFYGGGIVTARSEAMGALLDLIPTMPTPWLGLFGDADHSIPVEDVERLRHELAARAPVDTEIIRYPQAEHGFHCDARPSYQAAAALDGWNRTLVWLERHLAGQTP